MATTKAFRIGPRKAVFRSGGGRLTVRGGGGGGGFGGAYEGFNKPAGELAVAIDPTDPSATTLQPGQVLRSQADVDALAPFADVNNVIDGLGYQLYRHLVRMRLADGAVDVGDNLQLGALQLGADPLNTVFGGIQFESLDATGEQVPGTVDMPAASAAADGSFVLQSDPGYATDAFRKNNLEVVSGPGTGQSKPLEQHSGTTGLVAGNFTGITAASVFRITRPRATLRFDDNVIFPMIDMPVTRASRFGVSFSNVIVAGQFGAGSGLQARNGTIEIKDGAIMRYMAPSVFGGDIQLAQCIVDADGSFGMGVQGGVVRTLFGNSQPHLISGVGAFTPPISVIGLGSLASGLSQLFMFGGHVIAGGSAPFPNTDVTAVDFNGSAFGRFDVGSGQYLRYTRGAGVDSVAQLRNGAKAQVTSLAGLGATFTGATNDLRIDGAASTWAAAEANSPGKSGAAAWETV